MKNFFWVAMVAAAAFYAYSSWPGPAETTASGRSKVAASQMGNPVREIERAPKTLLEMQDAMGSSRAGVAHAARDAVSKTVGR
jgi:hypothetical protein